MQNVMRDDRLVWRHRADGSDGVLGSVGRQYLHWASVMNDLLRLTVLGAGYLGITHAACMASLGFEVLGVDIDARKVDQLNAGQLPIYEPGLRELLRSGLDSGRLAFTTSYPRVAAFGDVHFIWRVRRRNPAATTPTCPRCTGAWQHLPHC